MRALGEGSGVAVAAGLAPPAARDMRAEARVRSAVAEHHTFIWRALRRFGVAEEHADDAAQQVFCVFARRLADVPREKEKTFLCGVAVRVAQEARRQRGRRSEESDEHALASAPSPAPGPDEQLDDRRALATLETILQAMPGGPRAVFVLHEIEELTMSEISVALRIPAGTVASRLRRAREVFEVLAERARLAAAAPGGDR
ncbi:MAG TPA: sigma-70 family RNA polymerase sigma factor [Labilithrix sp.]|nr:sigma-70 family RNA polymerase sigma factor [Labilithrix sp.]